MTRPKRPVLDLTSSDSASPCRQHSFNYYIASEEDLYYGLRQTKSVHHLRPRNSYDTIIHRSSKKQLVKHQKSKLDLIDDTTLTSLPFPPPPPSSRIRRKPLGSVNTPRSPSHANRKHVENFGSSPRVRVLEDATPDMSLCSDMCEEESQDPIILVEDYLETDEKNECKESSRRMALLRKESLANFKRNYFNRHSDSDERSLWEQGSLFSTTQESVTSHKRENLEDIFGRIPGSDELRYCTLCDKPLYEISTLLTRSKKTSEPKLEGYTELVCSDCIETYDIIVNEVQDNLNHLNELDELALFQDNVKENIERSFQGVKKPVVERQVQKQFSDDLIGRLHELRKLAERRNEWFPKFRNKVKWTNLQQLLFVADDGKEPGLGLGQLRK